MDDKEAAVPIGATETAKAERLKALGNEAAGRGEHAEAHRLYSEAIKINPNNAIYYANRAAMLLAMKRGDDTLG